MNQMSPYDLVLILPFGGDVKTTGRVDVLRDNNINMRHF